MSYIPLTEVKDETDKIDSAAVDGLAGTSNSLAYKVEEIEKHFHNANQCWGSDGGTSCTRLSRIEFQIAAGNAGAMGTEVQLHDGTDIEGGSAVKKFDVNTFFVTAAGHVGEVYLVEIWVGTGAFGAATKATEFYYFDGANQSAAVPRMVPDSRSTCNNKIWARVAADTNGSTLDFLLELHTYDA